MDGGWPFVSPSPNLLLSSCTGGCGSQVPDHQSVRCGLPDLPQGSGLHVLSQPSAHHQAVWHRTGFPHGTSEEGREEVKEVKEGEREVGKRDRKEREGGEEVKEKE